MTIRRRLTLSFAAVLALFGASLGVYLWSAHLREVTMKRLDGTLKRRVILANIRQDLDNLHKQVALLSEVDVEGSQTPPDARSHQLFDEKLVGVSEQIQSLKRLSGSEDAAILGELDTTYSVLSQAWRRFYDYLGTEQAWAVASAAKADPLSYRLQTEIVPNLERLEKTRGEMAEARLARVEYFTGRISAFTFVISTFFAFFVAVRLGRSLARGFRELEQGTDLVGSMHLEHRIALDSDDELGQFARSFNTMAERLDTASKQLTAANEEIRQRQAAELRMAASIQQGLMDMRIPELSFASIRGRNVSCTEIGGDFYDVVPVDDGVAVIICDVAGKGISAAIMASMLQGMIRAELALRRHIAEIVEEANSFLAHRDVAGKYATLCIVVLDEDGALEYVNCGHVAPVLVSSGRVHRLDSNNGPVGLFPDMRYSALRCQLQPGDRIILVTDGVTEAGATDEDMFGDDRLEAAAAANDAFETVFAEVEKFCGKAALNDDCTVVEIAFHGVARSAAKAA